jgi:hypothetical protein
MACFTCEAVPATLGSWDRINFSVCGQRCEHCVCDTNSLSRIMLSVVLSIQ